MENKNDANQEDIVFDELADLYDQPAYDDEISAITSQNTLPAHCNESPSKTVPKKSKRVTKIISIFLWVVIFLLISFIVLFNTFTLVRVHGVSMRDTLDHGQYVLLFRNSRARRDEIIVYRDRGRNQNIIKTVIGIGGDELLFAREEGSNIYAFIRVNGVFEKISNPYLGQQSNQWRFINDNSGVYVADCIIDIINPPEGYILTVPADKFFVLGDNRTNSTDSRHIGFVHRGDIIGRVQIIVEKDSSLQRFLLFFYGRRAEEVGVGL